MKNRIHKSRSGVALVLVLAFLVLLSGLVLAFFTQATSHRQVADSNTEGVLADVVARSAMEIMIGDLKSEIADGSDAYGTPPVYIPKTVENLMPTKSGVSTTAAPKIPNLLKRSATGVAAYPNGPARASASSTSAASRNGRIMNPQRWNASYLMPKASTGTDDAVPVTEFEMPDWVVVTADGKAEPVTAGDLSALSNPSSPKYASGRFSYLIFDQSGLLDVNVAGYPTGLPSDVVGGKTSLAVADLANLLVTSSSTLGQTNVDGLVGWRNYATANPSGAFPGFTGFDTTAYGDFIKDGKSASLQLPTTTRSDNGLTDQPVLTRQQLLALRRSIGFSPNALKFMTHFSRASAAPTWGPFMNASELGGAGSGFEYRTDATSSSAVNPKVSLVRFGSSAPATLTYYSSDGRKADLPVEENDPIIRNRFSLKKLAWIGKDGPVQPTGSTLTNTELEAAILQDFGLVWEAASKEWKYVSGGGSSSASPATTVKTLATVASENRHPDFFELLKAGILKGSVGMQPAPVGANGLNVLRGGDKIEPAYDDDADRHIMLIGASMIDQADTDSFPTQIQFNAASFPNVAGSENIPYLHRFSFATYIPIGPPYPWPFHGIIEPTLWNPNQGTSTIRPAGYRIRMTAGSCRTTLRTNSGGGVVPVNAETFPAIDPAFNGDATITLTESASGNIASDTNNPTLLSRLKDTHTVSISIPTPIGDMGAKGIIDDGQSKYAGFWTGEAPIANTYSVNTNFERNSLAPLTFVYEVDYGSGASPRYKEVQRFYIGPDYTSSYGGVQYAANNSIQKFRYPERRFYHFGRIDPRTSRFGIYKISAPAYNTNDAATRATHMEFTGKTSFWDSTYQQNVTKIPKSNGEITFVRPGDTGPLYRIASNDSSSSVRYTDSDGVLRSGDGRFTSTSVNSMPLRGDDLSYRPTMLNRPFQNVGELGYVFRDMPWKSLDMRTENSADQGLLSLFTVQETPLTEDRAIAGVVNPNTPNVPVLAALLSGVAVGGNAATYFANSKAVALANQIVASTQGTDGPAWNMQELVSRIAPATTDTDMIKTREELITRGLAETSQTDTWNLLIDLVAQSGRFPASATTLDDFVVKGERRYWLHLAINRYTGEIVDQQLEPVLK